MASIETIRDAMLAQPFQPFALHLVDGTMRQVRHPDWIAIPPARRPRQVIVFSPMSDDPDEFRSYFVDVGLITEVIIPAPAAAD